MIVKRKKISQRLQLLDDMVTQPYDHIWDCCCDHGLLGLTLLQRQAADTIHFVDCVPSIMSELTTVLERFFTTTGTHNQNASWQVHCEDVGMLSILEKITSTDNPSTESLSVSKPTAHLVIIAGVGGEQTAELVTKILNNHPNQKLEFLLCPVHYHYHLRKRLQQLNCSLIAEKLLCENKRFYELIHVASGGEQRELTAPSKAVHVDISTVGSSMWDFSLASHKSYLDNTVKHYQRMAHNTEGNVSDIIKAYQFLHHKM
jgi:tRNA (adenine22-N1)-methyltransferase